MRKLSDEVEMRKLSDVTPEEWDELCDLVKQLPDEEDEEDTYELTDWFANAEEATKPSGVKNDKGKMRLDLIPAEAKEALGRILTYGAEKYDDNNWRKGIVYSRLLGAVYRHLVLFEKGVDLDDESGLRHIDHALCNLAFLSTFVEENREELDDRFRY